MRKFGGIIVLLISLVCFVFAIPRDIELEKTHPGDLRNRVVGSRLQMDGIPPYFYQWDTTKPLRYYDPAGYSGVVISNITSTPFMHQLLYPVANLEQRQISKLWMWLQYVVILVSLALVLKTTQYNHQKWMVLLCTGLFLFTHSWTSNIYQGQFYFLFSLWCILVYYLLQQSLTMWTGAALGLVCVSLVLVRPMMILFLTPFIFLIPRVNRKFILAFISSSVVLLVLAFGSSKSREYWADYRAAVQQHIRMHQGLDVEKTNNQVRPLHDNYEGWVVAQIEQDAKKTDYVPSGESGNLFVLFRTMGYKLPVWVNGVLLATAALILLLFTGRKYRSYSYADLVYTAALSGISLYMLSDFLSPVHRFPYNGGPWFFAICLVAMRFQKRYLRFVIPVLAISFFLNSWPGLILPMQRSVAEYLLLLICLYLIFATKHTLSDKNSRNYWGRAGRPYSGH